MTTQAEEAEVIEMGDAQRMGLTLHKGPQDQVVRRDMVAGMLRPVAAPADVIEAQNEVRELVAKALQDGRDYGKIPGTDKATLLKPGAERINAAYGLAAEYVIAEKEVDHDRSVTWNKRKKKWRNAHQGDREFTWDEETGVSYGLYRYVVECRLIHRASGVMVGQGLGSCSTMESKYIDRPREMENTIIKMAGKRAFIAATLNTHGLSDQFTQDMEDFAGDREPGNSNGSNGSGAHSSAPSSQSGSSKASSDTLPCPKCGGPCWDNRPKKASGDFKPNSPDFACKDKACGGKIWPEKELSPEEHAAELDRHADAIQSMIREMSGLDAEASDLAQQSLDTLKVKEGVKVAELDRLSGRVLTKLTELKQLVAASATYENTVVDFPDESDLPF